MRSTIPSTKAHSILRSIGIGLVILGFLNLAFFMGFVMLVCWKSPIQLWDSALMMIILIVEVPTSALLIYAGWPAARRPQTANARMVLRGVFVVVNTVLGFAGAFLIAHLTRVAAEGLHGRPWIGLFHFLLLLLCVAIYYAGCRRLRDCAQFSETQRAEFLKGPSLSWFSLVGLCCFITLVNLGEYFQGNLGPHGSRSYASLPFSLLVALILAVAFDTYAYGLACRYMDVSPSALTDNPGQSPQQPGRPAEP